LASLVKSWNVETKTPLSFGYPKYSYILEICKLKSPITIISA
jgi:hypothetical protein